MTDQPKIATLTRIEALENAVLELIEFHNGGKES